MVGCFHKIVPVPVHHPYTASLVRKLMSTIPSKMDIGAGLPLWAAFPDFERVDWINQIILALWPYAAAAAVKDVDLVNKEVLPKLVPSPVRASAIAKLGALPPTIEALRVFGQGGGDEVLVECAVRVAGDQEFGGDVALPLPFARASMRMAQGQFFAVMRIRIRPLIPRLPLAAGVSMGVVGRPLVDGAMSVKAGRAPRNRRLIGPDTLYKLNVCIVALVYNIQW